jgi:hypothetical protein
LPRSKKNDYYGKKFKLTVQVEDSRPWTFDGVTTHTDKRLVITQILKKILKTLYKKDNDTSFREFKELEPIKNKIKRIEEAMKNKKKNSPH